jgi:hypothetical protein
MHMHFHSSHLILYGVMNAFPVFSGKFNPSPPGRRDASFFVGPDRYSVTVQGKESNLYLQVMSLTSYLVTLPCIFWIMDWNTHPFFCIFEFSNLGAKAPMGPKGSHFHAPRYEVFEC